MKGGDHPGEALARIERRLGAHAGLKMPAWLVSSRVSDRMQALGLATMEQYLDALESRGELDALAESLRVGETSFFRHKGHMGALRRLVAPDLAARHADDKRVRAWSAGCASGEEPYTLAMLLAEAMPPERSWRLEVLATDISEEALAVARQGCYRAEALRSLPAALRDRWFERTGDGWRVNDELGRIVRFERRNLNEDHVRVRAMDVILCRNVLIYFEAEARRRTAHRLIDSLAPGGYLFFGYAESLREFEALEALRSPDGAVYRRPLEGKLPLSPLLPARASAPARAPAPAPASSGAGALAVVTVKLTGSYESGRGVLGVLKKAIAGAGEKIVVDLDGADFLADEVADVLRRAAAAAAAAGIAFDLHATRPGVRRFLTRHRLRGS